MINRRRKEVPILNTTSTADISFMLLVFFLVTSSMDPDKGMTRQLPPPEDNTEQQEVEVKQRNVMELRLDADNQLTCNDEPIAIDQLTQRVADFVANSTDDPNLPEKSEREVNLMGRCRVSDRHVITIEADRLATYEAYFDMQNAIVKGYNRLRNELALHRFGRNYDKCSQQEQEAIIMVYPQRISERVEPAKD